MRNQAQKPHRSGKNQYDSGLSGALNELTSGAAFKALFAPSACIDRVGLVSPTILKFLSEILSQQVCADLESLPRLPKHVFSPPDWQSVCGPDWEGHPFRHSPLFWSREAHEPDITKMIQRACSHQYAGRAAATRARTFLKALYESIAESPEPFFDFCRHSVQVEAEAPTEDGKRLDLLFCSEDGVVAIEAKFQASLNNPLELYEKHVSQKSGQHLFIILGIEDKRSSEVKERHWRFAHWADVLRNWESLLAQEGFDAKADTDFSRLRATIWTKLG